MSFLLLVRKLACRFAVAIPLVVSAQSGFAPLGGEYAIVGALPGDQVMPSVSINAAGGYVVWQDNATDGDGWGISGRALNSSLSGVQGAFRVNGTSKGDQENARVALLNNGGAVFVWQGGRQGFQHIYARFLSNSNTWLGLDQMVNASGKTYQANPAVTVLNNGNVVVVYASFNANTMQDVYGQIFSPTGQKIGGEFQLNQFTPYNQRSPSVAALNTGGFVAAWVSEQQGQNKVGHALGGSNTVAQLAAALPGVDIYARLFDAAGSAAIAEFSVNSSSNTCANPVVATTLDGSVMFAWSGKDSQVLNNGWDVFARPFTFPSSLSYVPGAERRVNEQLYGDQFAPHISSSGTNFFIAWTSMGQDGSAAGVYGRNLNVDGSTLGEEFRVNSSVVGAQQEPAVAGDGAGRHLAVWTSPSFSSSRNDLFAQVYADVNFVPPASTPSYAAPLFVGDAPAKVDALSSKFIPGPYVEPPVLDYPGALAVGGSVGVPGTNAFAVAAGNYTGLFYEAAGVSPASSGYFTAKTTAGRGYSAKLTMGATTYSISGTNDSFGNSQTHTIKRGALTPLTVTFQVDLAGGDQIRGQVKAGNAWTAGLFADRQVFDKATRQAPLAGHYTFALPAPGGGAGGPAGSGFGTAALDAGGGVTWRLTLGDGTKPSLLKSPGAISKSGVWPLYGSFGGGMVIGWIQFAAGNAAPNTAVTGDLICFKAAAAAAAFYKSGYTNEFSVKGALYLGSVAGASVVQLSGAGLVQAAQSSVQFSGATPVLGANLKHFTLKTDGSFTGSLLSPSLSFQGVMLEGGTGTGYFIQANKQSGPVNLSHP